MIGATSVFCQWEESESEWKCSQCGAVVAKSLVSKKPFAACRVGADKNGVPFREVSKAKVVPSSEPRLIGPGTELKKLLSKVGINAHQNCSCNSRAIQMNLWGPDICEQKIDEIVGWLREEATKRNLPFVNAAGRMLVQRAIKNARKQAASEKDVQVLDRR
jgi:hypothetical protein